MDLRTPGQLQVYNPAPWPLTGAIALHQILNGHDVVEPIYRRVVAMPGRTILSSCEGALCPGLLSSPTERSWPQWVPDQRPAMATLPAGAEPNVMSINPQEPLFRTPLLWSGDLILSEDPKVDVSFASAPADAQLGLYLVVANGNRRFGCYVAATSAVPAWSAARTCSRTNGWTLDNGARLEGVSAIFNIFGCPRQHVLSIQRSLMCVSAQQSSAQSARLCQPTVLRVLGSVTAGGRCACDGSKPICNDDWHGAFRREDIPTAADENRRTRRY